MLYNHLESLQGNSLLTLMFSSVLFWSCLAFYFSLSLDFDWRNNMATSFILLLLTALAYLASPSFANANSCVPNTDSPFTESTFGILPFEIPQTQEAVSSRLNCTEFRQRSLTADSEANYQGSCPWAYETDSDRNRIPVDMPRAYCICNGSCSNQGGGFGPGVCQEVTTPLKVLMRSEEPCVDDMYKYELRRVEWPVACQCSEPIFWYVIGRSSTTRFIMTWN